jgi:Spy/CpxP family protein refolding chaperone
MNNGNDFETTTRRERGRGRRIFWIIVGAFVVAGCVYALWTSPYGGPRRASNHVSSEWHIGLVANAIDLDAEQEEALRSVLERTRTATQDLERGERDLRDRLLVALQSEELDPAELARLRSSAVELTASAIDTFFDLTTEIWPELTPEQRNAVLRHWNRGG